MTVAQLPTRTPSPGLAAPLLRGGRPTNAPPMRLPLSKGAIARRRLMVGSAKRVLPLVALALLAVVALWPEISGDHDHNRFSYRRGGVEAESGQITDARYRGVDNRNRPYTMTAATAHQVSPTRIDLVQPKGDISMEGGSWLYLQSKQGVYMQHAGQLDLSGDVQLYRDDGTMIQTESAAIDLKAGAAAGAELVHAEGPFGALDAQGFAVTDSGAVMHFTGPGHLVINERRK